MSALFGGLQRFGIGRLAAIVGGAAAAIAIMAALMLNVGKQPQALLYANLDLKEASQISAALDQAGIKYEAKGDGSTLMVDRDSVASTRLMLSSKGLPTAGSVGYEIFDNASALGQTDFVQNLNRQRALEGELARTIRSLKGVDSARVHLVLPKRQLFEEEAGAPTASVVVGLSGRGIGADQVRSLRNLVAGAVPNLKPAAVTVIDETGKMLAAGAEDGEGFASEVAQGRRNEAEERVRRAVKDVVEGVVGSGKARVQVTADLDMTRVTLSEEKFDPDGQVVRSTTTSEEKSQESTPGADGAVTAGVNVPGGAGAGASGEGNSNGRNEETTNYEISKTTRTEVQEPGAMKRLSVAVAVDGVTTVGKNGKTTYAPRSAEEMKRIEQLVRSAVGFDPARGDQVSVVNVRFDHPGVTGVDGGVAAKAPLFDFDKNDILRGVELLILGVVGVLMILFVLRPIMSGSGAGGAGGGAFALPAPLGGSTTALASAAGGPAAQLAYAGDGGLALPGPTAMDERIDIAKIEGQVKVSSIKKVADFVDKHPEESVSILRGWLHES